MVQALAHQMRGDLPRALASLEGALNLAEPEGYVRTFVDEGAPMAALLAEAAGRRDGVSPTCAGFEPPWVRRRPDDPRRTPAYWSIR